MGSGPGPYILILGWWLGLEGCVIVQMYANDEHRGELLMNLE